MSLLSGFAQGAAAGTMGHWADVKDKVAAEAQMAFKERMQQKSDDAAMDRTKVTAGSKGAGGKGFINEKFTTAEGQEVNVSMNKDTGEYKWDAAHLNKQILSDEELKEQIQQVGDDEIETWTNSDGEDYAALGGKEAWEADMLADLKSKNTLAYQLSGGVYRAGGADDSEFMSQRGVDPTQPAAGQQLPAGQEPPPQVESSFSTPEQEPEPELQPTPETLAAQADMQTDQGVAAADVDSLHGTGLLKSIGGAIGGEAKPSDRPVPEPVSSGAEGVYSKQKQDHALKSWRGGKKSTYAAKLVVQSPDATPEEKAQAEQLLQAKGQGPSQGGLLTNPK